MKILLCLFFITGCTIAFPQYGGNVQTDAEVVSQVEEISQKEVNPDLPEHPVNENLEHSNVQTDAEVVSQVEEISQKEVIPDLPEHPVDENLEHSNEPEHPKTSELTELIEQIRNPEDPQHSDFNKEQQEKLTNYWWKVSGIFSGSDKDKPSDIEPGLGVGGPFTPQQSKFCEVGFDCVPFEICVDGFIALHGQTILQQRIKPTNYETNQCGQEGNICCAIPKEVLEAHRENIGTIDVTGDKIEVLQPHVDPQGPISSGPISEHGESFDSSKVIEEGKIDTVVPDKPVAPVVPYEPVSPVNPNEPVVPVVVDTNIQTDKEDGEQGFPETGVSEIQVSPVHTSTVIKSENDGVGGYGPSIPSEAGDPLIDSSVVPGHSDSSSLIDPIRVEHIDKTDACGHASYTCVPYFQCVDGVINVDGTGLIDVRIKPQSVCEHPDFPNVPGVCCLKPDHKPTPAPATLSECPNHQECIPGKICPSKGDFGTDGRGQLDLRTGPKKCHWATGDVGVCCDSPSTSIETCPGKSVCVSKLECFGQALSDGNKFIDYANTGSWTHCSKYSDGVCCLQPERITLDVCPGNSQCVKEEHCSGQALDGNRKLVDYVSGGTWSYCSVGDINGICCSSQKPEILEDCPGKSKCILSGQCSGQAIDSSGNIVAYPSNGLWRQCSFGTSYGICCILPDILPEPVLIEKCPGNSICIPGDQCSGQAIDESGKFIDYVSGGSWSICLLDNINGVCCISPAPVIRETCPEGSKCIIGNQCKGLAMDGNNNFISYVPSGSWSYCSLSPENGICCKEDLPSRLVDVCPLQSVCLRPEQCIGKALDADKNFIDYANKDGLWSHCSEYEGGVCCQNPETPKDPGHLQPAPLCGIRNYKIDERITSNKVPNEATFGEFPWQSIIFYQNYTFVCGATLISNKFVITAAHCVDGIKPQDIKIRFGEWIVSNVEEVLPYVDRNVYKIHIHPEFNPKNVHKDFAVIEMVEPVEFQYHINSVCIPNQGYMVEPYSQCFTTGWGKDSFEGEFQSTLKKIDLPFIEHEKCQNLLRRTRLGKYFRLDPSFNCAGGEENKDACYGDGGGPLVCKDKGSSQYQLIGITSWGIGCGQKDIPGVYANVPEYSNWINSIIKIQAEQIPEQYKESFAPILEETVNGHQGQRHEAQHQEDLKIEDIPEQVKTDDHHQGQFESIEEQVKDDHHQQGEIESFPDQVKQDHHQEGHIESIPEAPAPSYGK